MAASYWTSSVPTTQLVINDCFADPCLNNATCISLNAGYTCQCAPGWTGTIVDYFSFGITSSQGGSAAEWLSC